MFDGPIDPAQAAAFLADPRHHMVVALCDGLVIGFVSGIHYLQPDKAPEFWVNEIGVKPDFRRSGLATRLLKTLFRVARDAGCRQAWVLTNTSNKAARRLFESVGGAVTSDAPVMFDFDLP